MVDAVVRLFPENATDFTSNGIGYLVDVVSCIVEEERNGSFTLSMDYPITGRHYEEIDYRKILVAKPNPYDPPQPFRITHISRPFKGVVTFDAEHISYDMSGYPIKGFKATTPAEALNGLKKNCPLDIPFTFWTDKTNTGEFIIDKPYTMRSVLGSENDYSILASFDGELQFDRFTVKLYENRGTNRGFTIRYAKNLTDITQDEDAENVYSGIMPYWQKETEDSITTVYSNPEIIPVKEGLNFTRIYVLDCTSYYNEQPTPADLKKEVEYYLKENNALDPKKTVDVSFADLVQNEDSELIRNLEMVRLCDTVTVEYADLGISTSLKCISTEYDAITDRYTNLTLGDPKSNLANTIVRNKSQASSDLSSAEDNWNYELDSTEKNIRADMNLVWERIDKDVDDLEIKLRTEISISADGIKTDVSKIYETKENAIESYNELEKSLTVGLETTSKALQSSIEQTAERIRTDVAATYETKQESLTMYDDLKGFVTTNINETKKEFTSSIEQTAQGITTSVAATYETKTQVKAYYNDLSKEISASEASIRQDYQSEIRQTASSITSTVASTYQTKQDAKTSYQSMQSSIEQTANSIKLKVDVGSVSSEISQEEGDVTIKGNRLTIESNNFKLSKTGQVEASGTFATYSKSGSVNFSTVLGQGGMRVYYDNGLMGSIGPYNTISNEGRFGIAIASSDYVAICGSGTGYLYDPNERVKSGYKHSFNGKASFNSGLYSTSIDVTNAVTCGRVNIENASGSRAGYIEYNSGGLYIDGTLLIQDSVAMYGNLGLGGHLWGADIDGETIVANTKMKAGTYTIIGNEIQSNTGWHAVSSGNVYLHADTYCTSTSVSSYYTMFAADFVKKSTRASKINIRSMEEEDALKLLDVDIVRFDYINGAQNKAGMIAEDVVDLFPDTCGFGTNEETGKKELVGIDYSNYVPYLIKMVQMQQKQLDQMGQILKEHGLMA